MGSFLSKGSAFTLKTRPSANGLAKIGLVTALYLCLTLLLNPLSYGAVQLRLGEGLNHLTVFHRRYILALTLACALANLMSPLGIIDVIFGSLETLIMTSVSYWLTRHVKRVTYRLGMSTLSCTFFSWIIALELHFISHIPFWPTYATIALGELASLLLGAVVIYALTRRIDLTV
ncbi:QueT transporter family protein [Loigolactobacillus bifermentans]|jgi:uncharacterized membrane protein|uniref:QueT transporter family protein n=1 Tax=Loigolactobacillus bifermentans TaxID=1607 RepID=UPI0009F82172|nr:QueT transporter family protein [Loigolactobacillus bifermentans]QGG59248.1 QueT transporter family protein [Loigolactobacillus bifermentans]